MDCILVERKIKCYDNDLYFLDVEWVIKKRLFKLIIGSGFLCIKVYGIVSIFVRKFGDLFCLSLKIFLENRVGVTNVNVIIYEIMDRFFKFVNDIF